MPKPIHPEWGNRGADDGDSSCLLASGPLTDARAGALYDELCYGPPRLGPHVPGRSPTRTSPREPSPLEKLIASASPPPCDGCEHRARCINEQLACQAFAAYTNLGRCNGEAQVPRHDVYERLFRW